MDTLPGKSGAVLGVEDDRIDENGRGADVDYQALAAFRYLIRRFLVTSEAIARTHNVNPQQHQCLLAIAGRPSGVAPTVGYVAVRLLIEHNSAVGLVDRLVGQGLVERRPSEIDRRQVEINLTERGAALLEQLSFSHRQELRVLAPRLVNALQSMVEKE